jgi:large subunit ribosomal protein L7/L12
MKDHIKETARKIARMSSSDIDDLATALMEHSISATIYRFSAEKSIFDEDRECDLWLEKTGMRKLQMVKEVKEIFGLGLRDAKRLIDSAPCYLKEFMPVIEAREIAERLTDVGATVQIKYHD